MKKAKAFSIIDAHDDEYLAAVRTLFRSYESSLDTNPCFQDFEKELTSLPGRYAPPDGCLLLAEVSSKYAGCVALRKMAEGVCEMKRLYVDPEFRGQGIGICLIQEVIERAPKMGYQFMRLDTLPVMEKAITLYDSLGFIDISSSIQPTLAGVRYMQLDLDRRTTA